MVTSNAILKKAIMSVMKLLGCENWHMWSTTMQLAMDHTWDYVRGDSTVKPEESNAEHDAWVTQDRAAHQRIFLALSDEVKESILHLANSPAAVIFKSLKESYEYLGTSAKYYTRQDYHNAKVNNYDSIGDFITGLTKLAHQVNKTTSKATDHIGD